MYACNGILFNHESPIRGETFVTRKITRAAVRIARGVQEKLFLGNLSAQRDWGHAKDYVEGMWRMMQLDQAEDFVLATGVTHTVRTFCEMAFDRVGIQLRWEGEGAEERGVNVATGESIIEIDPRYFRPTEVDLLIGDATKAKEKLGWVPTHSLDELVADMVDSDRAELERELLTGPNGF
jgi:GDPmannose 4,6-dehydratase